MQVGLDVRRKQSTFLPNTITVVDTTLVLGAHEEDDLSRRVRKENPGKHARANNSEKKNMLKYVTCVPAVFAASVSKAPSQITKPMFSFVPSLVHGTRTIHKCTTDYTLPVFPAPFEMPTLQLHSEIARGECKHVLFFSQLNACAVSVCFDRSFWAKSPKKPTTCICAGQLQPHALRDSLPGISIGLSTDGVLCGDLHIRVKQRVVFRILRPCCVCEKKHDEAEKIQAQTVVSDAHACQSSVRLTYRPSCQPRRCTGKVKCNRPASGKGRSVEKDTKACVAGRADYHTSPFRCNMPRAG